VNESCLNNAEYMSCMSLQNPRGNFPITQSNAHNPEV
jgi:hypothetical protein